MANSNTRLLTISAVLALGGGVLVAAGPSAIAQPMCDGEAATIVVTEGDQTVEGTARPDVILVDGDHAGLVVRGNGGDDRICGGAHAEWLYGGPGRDRILAAGGADLLFGGPGVDLLAGGVRDHPGHPNDDRMQYFRPGAGRDVVRGSAATPSADVVDYSHSRQPVRIDLAYPGRGTDEVHDVGTLIGSRFGDRLRGTRGRDKLFGMGGDDRLAGRGRFDSMYGDSSSVFLPPNLPVGAAGRPGDDRLKAGRGDDYLQPGPGHNFARGGPAQDVMSTDQGRGDVLDGGDGYDGVHLTSHRRLDLDLRDPGAGPSSTVRGFERFGLNAPSGTVHGTAADDDIHEGHTEGLTVHGHGGSDDLAARIVHGGAGDDEIRDSRVATGGEGSDELLWDETAYGGPGDDRLAGDDVAGGAGDDTVHIGWDTGASDETRLRYRGGPGDDTFPHLITESREGVGIDGGDGRDKIILTGPHTSSSVDLAAGTESVTFDADPAGIFTATVLAVEKVRGSPGDDELFGDGEDNRLIGYRGEDTVDGRGGTDTCEGETVSNCEQ